MLLIEAFRLKELNQLQKKINAKWQPRGVRLYARKVQHFKGRSFDERNVKPIEISELYTVFNSAFERFGKKWAQIKGSKQFVLSSKSTGINIPIVVKYVPETEDVKVIPKTIMRKAGFQTKAGDEKLTTEKRK